jgi:hypothetical protein
MRTIFMLAAAGLLSACGFGPDYPQFSQASYRIEGMSTPASGGAPAHTVIYRDGPKMRIETALANYGQATVVFDDATNAAYVLDPAATPGAAIPTQGAAPAAETPMPVDGATSPTAAVAPDVPTSSPGLAVRLDNADAPQPLETAWAALGAENARSKGRCEVAGEHGHEWTPRRPPAQHIERVACITEDGIVLRVAESGRTLWEATSLQRGEQDQSLFGVPAGYRMIDPRAVAAQTSEQPVAGAPPEPEEAPPPRG